MGQKVNPHGLRVGVIKDWDSRWFAKDAAFGDILVEDYKVRRFLKKTLYDAGVPALKLNGTPQKSGSMSIAPVRASLSVKAAKLLSVSASRSIK